MSAPLSRADVFLAEMGIGPVWTLRAQLVADADEAALPTGEASGHALPIAAGATDQGDAARTAAAGLAAPPASPHLGNAGDVGAASHAANGAQLAHRDGSASAFGAAGAARAGDAADADAAWTDDAASSAPPSDADIANMNWAQLRAAVASCSRCTLCRDGRKPVFGSGAQTAQWAIVAGATSAADQQQRQPMSGEAGALLRNMLAAAGMSREKNVYVTNLIKGRPLSANGAERAPTAEEAAACRPYAEREIALSGAQLVLTLGQIAANGLLGKPLAEALAGTRGSVHRRGELPLVATLHPGELLRRGSDKAQAWIDLCLAASARDDGH